MQIKLTMSFCVTPIKTDTMKQIQIAGAEHGEEEPLDTVGKNVK